MTVERPGARAWCRRRANRSISHSQAQNAILERDAIGAQCRHKSSDGRVVARLNV